MLGGHKPGKDLHSAGFYGKIVVAAAKRLTAVLHNTQSPALCTVVGSEFLHPHHAVCNAVNGLVIYARGQVVEQAHGCVALRKIVLQRQNLSTIAKGALREQSYF